MVSILFPPLRLLFEMKELFCPYTKLTSLLFCPCSVSIYALFKIKNEITFPTKITEAIKVRTQCHYAMAAWTFNFLIY